MLRSLLMAALSFGLAGSAPAQNYPTKPITYIFPFSPGPGDATMRPIFEKFRERTGQPIVIDFRVGANAMLVLQALQRAPADGYALSFISSSSLGSNLAQYILPWGLDDFAPVTQIG